MTMQIFSGRGRNGDKVKLPMAYRRSVGWVPKLGDQFPDFEAGTTAGRIRFFDWADAGWSFLFSHPVAHTPVCTTEIAALSAAREEFESRGVRLLGFTASEMSQLDAWHADIRQMFGVPVPFPTVSDPTGEIARVFGMYHEKVTDACPIRKSFILDPQMRIRMILEYPVEVGRSTDEVLRCIDALQAVDAHGVAVPADWAPGEDFLLAEPLNDGELRWRYGRRATRLRSYLTVLDHDAVIAPRTEPRRRA